MFSSASRTSFKHSQQNPFFPLAGANSAASMQRLHTEFGQHKQWNFGDLWHIKHE
jgi:hypothetical protein